MKHLMTCAALVALVACGGGTTVTGPTSEAPATPVAAATPAPSAPQSVVPGEGGHVGTIDGANFKIENRTRQAAKYAARIYEVYPGGEQQLRQEQISGNVPGGESWSGVFAALPCNYQIDLDHYFEVRNPPAPGELGSKIVTGRECPRPEPTPTPEPSPEPTPTPSPSPSPTPEPTCEELNPTSFYDTFNVNFQFKSGWSNWGELSSANVHTFVYNKDVWRLELWASTTESTVNTLIERQTVQEDTSGDNQVRIKDVDVAEPVCGKKVQIKVQESNHPWKYWFYRLYKNGSLVFTSELFKK